MSNVKYVVDENASIAKSYVIESTIYTDSQGVDRVAHSSQYRGSKSSLDMTWPEYEEYMAERKPKMSFKVIDSKEHDVRMNLYRQEQMKEEKKITEKDYWWLLECLPPRCWQKVCGVEVFYVSELICFDLVQWVGQVGNNYYKLVDSAKAEPIYIAKRFIELDKKLTS